MLEKDAHAVERNNTFETVKHPLTWFGKPASVRGAIGNEPVP